MIPLSDGTMSLHVDDNVLYRTIYTPADYYHLRRCQQPLCWTDDNNLKFNTTHINAST